MKAHHVLIPALAYVAIGAATAVYSVQRANRKVPAPVWPGIGTNPSPATAHAETILLWPLALGSMMFGKYAAKTTSAGPSSSSPS